MLKHELHSTDHKYITFIGIWNNSAGIVASYCMEWPAGKTSLWCIVHSWKSATNWEVQNLDSFKTPQTAETCEQNRVATYMATLKPDMLECHAACSTRFITKPSPNWRYVRRCGALKITGYCNGFTKLLFQKQFSNFVLVILLFFLSLLSSLWIWMRKQFVWPQYSIYGVNRNMCCFKYVCSA